MITSGASRVAIDRAFFVGLLSLGLPILHVEPSVAQSPPPVNLIAGAGCTFVPGPNYHGGTGTISCGGTAASPLVTAVDGAEFIVSAGTLHFFTGAAMPATPGSAPVLINGNIVGSLVPAPVNGTVLQIVSATTPAARIELDALAGFIPELVMRRADGTAAAPTAVQSGEFLGGLFMTGYTGAAYAQPNRVEIVGYATETWDATRQGSGIAFNVVTKGGTVQANGMTFLSNAGSIGIALFGSLGASGVADGAAPIQTHEALLAGSVELGVSTGPTITQGAGAPAGTVTAADLYIRNDGSAGAGLYFANAGGTHVAIDNPAPQWNAGTVTTVAPSGSLAAGTLSIPAPSIITAVSPGGSLVAGTLTVPAAAPVTAAGLGAVINSNSVQINNAVTLAGTAAGTLSVAPGSGTSDVVINMPVSGGTVTLGCAPSFAHQRWIESITQGTTAGVLNLGAAYIFGTSPASYTITATPGLIDRLAILSPDGTRCAVMAIDQGFSF